MIRAAVFDLDGTLANTPSAIVRLLAKVASEQGRSVSSAQATRTFGKPLETAFAELLRLPEGHENVSCSVARFRELFGGEILGQGPRLLYPGVASGLGLLRDRGVELAVATSKASRSAEALLEIMGIREMFGPIVCHDMVRKGKPHPEMALRAVSALGVPAQESAYVGDTAEDMRMAVTARMRPIAVTYGVGRFAQLASVAETRLCSSFDEVVTTLTAVRPRLVAAAGRGSRA